MSHPVLSPFLLVPLNTFLIKTYCNMHVQIMRYKMNTSRDTLILFASFYNSHKFEKTDLNINSDPSIQLPDSFTRF